jgi:membrane glycosyltransferase
MTGLVLGLYGALAVAFWAVFSVEGWTIPELVMFACFMVSTPWIVIGFWNGVIGFALLRFSSDPTAAVAPCVLKARADDVITSRTAVAMCIRHEDPHRVVRRLRAILHSLDTTGHGDRFDLFVLSDSSRADAVAEEEAAILAWRATLPIPARVIYRRRTSNVGFKAGNVRDFLETHGDAYDFMITLDADSVMSGETILRLVRVMQANPKLGILQSLIVGLPARTVFARAFQFGMRATMRSYALGAAWWSGDCGPYWGHNAAIRVAAFREHAQLPELPGSPPLGGTILSHDLYEAALMRRAGYEVRVLPEEGGSWEDNPATLPEFLRRNLRWCQGNLQYLKLIGEPGHALVARINLLIAILMYAGAPAWMLFMVAAAAQAWDPGAVFGAEGAPSDFPWSLGAGLLTIMMLVLFAPKIAGYLDVALRPGESRRYGGLGVFLLGAAAEVAFGLLFAPIVSFSVTVFLIRLFVLRRGVGWDAQDRDGRRISWREATRQFWPAAAFGAALAVSIALSAPEALFWTAPILVSFLLAIPFAALSSLDAPDASAARIRLAMIPEEAHPPAEVRAVSTGPAAVAPYAPPLVPFRFDLAAEPGRLRALEDVPG